MVDSRTNYAKEISGLLRETYGSRVKVFGTDIPHSVRASEISAEGKSIFAHDPKGKVAAAYHDLTKEVLRVVDQASPGARMAAWGFSFQSLELPSGLGRLCQGSMHTKRGIPGLLQMRV